MHGPTLRISQEKHAEKYRAPGESFKEAMNRVASALTDKPEEFHRFREIILDMRFMPAGRVQNAMGSTKAVTPYNCYVSGTIEDSFVHGEGSIMARAAQAAATMRMGGGIGYDFSPLRPRGDLVRKLQSQSSGAPSFMRIYNEIGLVTSSSGHRRGAQMAVLRIDHPDVEEFVRVKQNNSSLTGFNISLAVTDEFMRALRQGTPFPLRFERRTYREINPVALWETIMRSTWDWAEPGVLFIDRINDMNNLWYCETIAATNPCGEQPLPPFGACLLGSFNLVRYLIEGTKHYTFNYEQLRRDVEAVVPAMDNVVDRAVYPLYEQEKEAKGKRRMGLGVTGVANALEAMGLPYGTPEFVEEMKKILALVRDTAYRSSARLAGERGPFPKYREDEYLGSKFISKLPADIRDLIAQNGIRNSHLLSIAPCGTISLCADNVSSGIEPVFLHEYNRTIQEFDGPRIERIVDYGVRELGVHGRTTDEVSPKEHIEVLAAAYEFVDSAVSKTVNVPPTLPWDDFKDLYVEAWERGCKGCTTYQKGSKRGAVLEEVKPDEGEVSCQIDPDSGRRDCD